MVRPHVASGFPEHFCQVQARDNCRTVADSKHMAEVASDRLHRGAPAFCQLAGEIIALWEMQRKLFGVKTERSPIRSARFGLLFPTLNSIVIDYWFLAVAKLHDPAYTSQWNISVKYFSEAPNIGSNGARLQRLASEMQAFAEVVRTPRNKLLAHNDADSMARPGWMGAFPEDEDVKYVARLREFATIVSTQFRGEPFLEADQLLGNDIDAFLSALQRGIDVIDGGRGVAGQSDLRETR